MPLSLRSVFSSATGAIGFAACSAVAGDGGATLTGVAMGAGLELLKGIGQNAFANGLQELFDGGSGGSSPEGVAAADDLRQLVARAIGLSVRKAVGDRSEAGADARRLAEATERVWLDETRSEPISIEPAEVVRLFRQDQAAPDQPTVGGEGDWLALLADAEHACERDGPAIEPGLAASVARRLPRELPAMIRGVFLEDAREAGGGGFAHLQLATLAVLGETTNHNAIEATTVAQVERLRAVAERIENAAGRQASRLVEGEAAELVEAIRDSRERIDRKLDEHLARLTAEQGRIRRRLGYVAAGVAAVAGLGVVGVWTGRSGDVEVLKRVDETAGSVDASLERFKQELLAELGPKPGDDDPEKKKLSPELLEKARELAERGDREQRAVAQIALGQHEEADRLIQLLKRETLDEAYRLLTLEGDNWYEAGDYDRAIGPYEKALALRPDDPDAMDKAAIAHCDARLGSIEAHQLRAIQLLERAAVAMGDDRLGWAMVQNNLGAAYVSLPTGNLEENLRKAIDCYQGALTVYQRQSYPSDWARVQNNLGNAYDSLPTGDREENLRKAIACYEAALTVYTRESHPLGWASTLSNLGTSLVDLPTGDRAANVRRAIEVQEQSLEIYTREDHPVEWARVQGNLGIAYWEIPNGDRMENLLRAIRAYDGALEVYTRDEHPMEWARMQKNRGVSYRNLPEGDPDKNTRKAIESYRLALEVYTRESQPLLWAATMNNMAFAYECLCTGDRAGNIRQAIRAYEQVLEVQTKEEHPLDWALVNNNLGIAYEGLPIGDRSENLGKAIQAYERALGVYTREAEPVYWAWTHTLWGSALLDLPSGDRVKNTREAIERFGLALEETDREQSPSDWASLQCSMGYAHLQLLVEEGEETGQPSPIEFLQQALEVYTREAFPGAWAGTQHDLSQAHRKLPGDDRPESLRRALASCERALSVRTREARPWEWAETQHELAAVLADLAAAEPEQAAAWSERSLAASRAALEVYTAEAFPREHREAQELLDATLAEHPTVGSVIAHSGAEARPVDKERPEVATAGRASIK